MRPKSMNTTEAGQGRAEQGSVDRCQHPGSADKKRTGSPGTGAGYGTLDTREGIGDWGSGIQATDSRSQRSLRDTKHKTPPALSITAGSIAIITVGLLVPLCSRARSRPSKSNHVSRPTASGLVQPPGTPRLQAPPIKPDPGSGGSSRRS